MPGLNLCQLINFWCHLINIWGHVLLTIFLGGRYWKNVYNKLSNMSSVEISVKPTNQQLWWPDNSSKVCLANGSWSGPTDYYDCMCKVFLLIFFFFAQIWCFLIKLDLWLHMQGIFFIFLCWIDVMFFIVKLDQVSWLIKWEKRSSWLNCALWDDEL